MEYLIEKYRRKIQATDLEFIRGMMSGINWNARLIGIKGPRGVGKTTLLLQYIKKNLGNELDNTLYVSLDDIWFGGNTLSGLADQFVKKGGKYLFLDEVHKYEGWSQEVKNIYDDHAGLKIVFTGSSLLSILNARADLSRRAVVYMMAGLSYREFLNIRYKIDLKPYTLEDVLHKHVSISETVLGKVRPLQFFDEYLRIGYYPFFLEEEALYQMRLEEVVNMILEIELPLLRQVDAAYIGKLRQLLYVISQSVPFTPNVTKLSERIGINRNTLISYLHYLHEARLINAVYKGAEGISLLQKPDKILLENTNLMHLLSGKLPEPGNLRETFFVNQLSHSHAVNYSTQGDYLVDHTYTFEVGGRRKNTAQIKGIENAYIAADNLEYGFQNKIPLWQFGLLY